MLTGRPAIGVGDAPAMLHEVCYGMPPRPSSLVTLPPAVDDVLAIGLAKQPQERFAAAGELARALEVATVGALPSALARRAAELEAQWPWSAGILHWPAVRDRQ